MLPDIIYDIDASVENESTDNVIGKSFLFDFSAGDFVVKDGKVQIAEGIESVKAWIEKIIRTEKYKFPIYDEYGITLQDLIGHDYPIEFVRSEIEREVTEALLSHPSIERLDDWIIDKNNPVTNISFTVVLKDGVTFSYTSSIDTVIRTYNQNDESTLDGGVFGMTIEETMDGGVF